MTKSKAQPAPKQIAPTPRDAAIERLYQPNPFRAMPAQYKSFTLDQHLRLAETMVMVAELASYRYHPHGSEPSVKREKEALDLVDEYKRIISALRHDKEAPDPALDPS